MGGSVPGISTEKKIELLFTTDNFHWVPGMQISLYSQSSGKRGAAFSRSCSARLSLLLSVFRGLCILWIRSHNTKCSVTGQEEQRGKSKQLHWTFQLLEMTPESPALEGPALERQKYSNSRMPSKNIKLYIKNIECTSNSVLLSCPHFPQYHLPLNMLPAAIHCTLSSCI